MDDDSVRTLLQEHQASFFGQEAGFAAVPIAALEEAGANIDKIQGWVEERGGRRAAKRPRQSQQVGGKGLLRKPPPDPVHFFEVPRSALS